MSGYVRKNLQILGGGFNMLPPGDKTPAKDYSLAQNWRVDRDGKLTSRWGYPLKFTIAGPAYAHSGANNGGDESNYYIGANAASGSNPGSVWFNGTTSIMTGLSGFRVGFASMLGYMFIMDRVAGKQARHNGTTIQTWGIIGPTSALTPAAGATDVTGPSGSYQFYVTYETTDLFYETAPSPVSITVTVVGKDIDFSGIPISPDARIGIRNIYATGGTLGNAYLVLSIPNNTATTGTWDTNDLIATSNGIIMPIGHTLPPNGQGLAGPFFDRLYTWVGNRLYYTPPGQPQYWNTDAAVGDWVDVGNWGEQIMWCTSHTNVLMIYKEKSIWRLIGDPVGGSLEILEDGVGLINAFAITSSAGPIDYFVSPNGLRRCNLDKSELFAWEIQPLFNSPILNGNTALEMPGSILPGPLYISSVDSLDAYAVSLGYAMGKLYLSYGENVTAGNSSVTMVWDERSGRWMYHRNAITTTRFYGFYFDGLQMIGLTGTSSGGATALGVNVDDFRGFTTEDEPSTGGGGSLPFECIYKSHYEDAGLPDNQKVWLEIVIDCFVNTGVTATVEVGYDNNLSLGVLGTIAGTSTRRSYSFTLGIGGLDGRLAKNIAAGFRVPSTATSGSIELHNVFLYFYVEARLALAAATLPTDLGTIQIKQCKELALDIDASAGGVSTNLYSDLPGNALAVQHVLALATMGGRGIVKFPFAVTEGYLWRVALIATTAGMFRLYGARLLCRLMGTYIEAYEAAAGFVWDSQEMTFETGLTHIPRLSAIALAATPIKRFREITLEIDTFNANVTLTFLTDLPGNAMTSRFTATVNTSTTGRRFVRIPLTAGIAAPWEGRTCRIKLSGSAKFVLYDAAVELIAVGVYIEAYEAAGGAVYDSREIDFGSAKPKECRELDLDIETTGNVTATLYYDLPGYTVTQSFAATFSTTGRERIKIPLTLTTAPFTYPIGRLFRLVITGTNAFRLYGASAKLREFGTYLTGDEAGASPIGVWDSTPLDLGTERDKEFKKFELEIQTDTGGTATFKVWTDQPNGDLGLEFTTTITTTGTRQSVKIPLTPGIRGRLIQVEISGSGAALFAGRVWWRPMNELKEQSQWRWSDLPIEPTPPLWKFLPFPVNPTEAQWIWCKVLSVDPTDDKWQWVDVPFEVTGS